MTNDSQQADRFLIKCKENYFKGIRPANLTSKHLPDYKFLVNIAKDYFDNNKEVTFSEFFKEGQYFIELWAAHLILEYGNPDFQMKKRCLEIIEKYSTSTMDEIVAKEESDFLKSYYQTSN